MFSLAVIIPNYNNGKYLENGIKSILQQTLLPDEVIIVDDCSTDDSRNVIIALQQQYGKVIRPLFLEKNGGVSNARNCGLNYAESEYVTFMDADDYYFSSEKLSNEMKLIRYAKEQGKDVMAYSAIVRVDNYGNILSQKPLKKSLYMSGDSRLTMISREKSDNIPRDYCISKKILISSGAYSYYKNFYEDLDLLMRLSEMVDFQFTGQYGTAYRFTPDGLSKRSENEHNDTVAEIINTYYAKLDLLDKAKTKYMNIKWRLCRKVQRVILHMKG